MDSGKSVAEFALEQRIAELERELYLARMESAAYPRVSITPPKEPVATSFPPPKTLTLAAAWQCDYDVRLGEHVRGEAWFKDAPLKFGFQYYMKDLERFTPNDALQYLGLMHMDVMRQLAKHYGKPKP